MRLTTASPTPVPWERVVKNASNRRSRASASMPIPAEFPANGVDLDAKLEDLERRLITEALAASGGVRKRAAELLNISFRSLRYRLEKLNMKADGDD